MKYILTNKYIYAIQIKINDDIKMTFNIILINIEYNIKCQTN